MNSRFFLISLFAAALLGLVTAVSSVSACACCDGRATRVLLGWSDSGNSAIVHMDSNILCDWSQGLEVWVKNVSRPTGCFDFYGDPKKRIDCALLKNALEELNEELIGVDTVPPPYNYRLQYYPVPPTRLDARYVRVTGTLMPFSEEMGLLMPKTAVSVYVLAAGEWHEVLKGDFYDSSPEAMTDPYMPIDVVIYPAPAGDVGLLKIDGHDTKPGIGAFSEDLYWVSLPKNIGPLPAGNPPSSAKTAPSNDSVQDRLIYQPLSGRPHKQKPKGASVRLNTLGFQEYQKGNMTDALSKFIRALEVDAYNHLARFNLACVLARMGFVERALEQLKLFDNPACEACAKQLAKAAKDDDLKSLRGHPTFERLIAAAKSPTPPSVPSAK